MSFLFSNDILFSIIFFVCVFILMYLNTERIIAFAHKRTLGTKEEVLELMDKMLIETNQKKISILLYLISFGLGAIFFLLFWPNLILGSTVAVAMTFAGWSLPKLIMHNLWERRCNRVVEQMVDGMVIMANGIKSGLSTPQSLERVVVNITGPLSQEFNLILNKTRLGMSLEEAFNEFAERIPRPDVQMFVTSVNILKETGGNLAETFETITYTIRERQKIHKKIEALTSSSIMQGIIITLVPFFLLIVFFVMDPNYIMPLFTKPLGWFFLFLMLALQVIGGIAMKKIVTIKV